jgi:rubrerythrin
MDRRQFLIAAPAGVLAACGGNVPTDGPAGDPADIPLLAAALDLEYGAIAAYEAGLELARTRRPLLERIREHERAHAEGLRQAILDLRGKPAAARPAAAYAAAFPRMRDEAAFVHFAEDLERRVAGVYLKALPKLRTLRLRGTLAAMLAAEAEHAALLSGDPLERVLPL